MFKITKINLDKDNRMLRLGFGKHEGKWFLRIDLWKVGCRITVKETKVEKKSEALGKELLDFDPSIVPLILSGRKSSLTLRGIRNLRSDFIGLKAGNEMIPVIVTDFAVKSFKDLTKEDAIRDGFGGLFELKSALRSQYENIEEGEPFTIIGFRKVI